jgi:hypothetical protein
MNSLVIFVQPTRAAAAKKVGRALDRRMESLGFSRDVEVGLGVLPLPRFAYVLDDGVPENVALSQCTSALRALRLASKVWVFRVVRGRDCHLLRVHGRA